MKKLFTILFILLNFLSITDYCFGQWVQVSGIPAGTIVNKISFLNNTTVRGAAGTNAGIYISSGDCITWTKATTGLPATYSAGAVKFLHMNNGNDYLFARVYSSTGGDRIYYSTNYGSSWALRDNNITTGHVATDFATDSTWIWVSTTDRVYKSSNDGATWSMVTGGLLTLCPYSCLEFAGQNRFAGSESGNGYYYSVNGGNNWTNIQPQYINVINSFSKSPTKNVVVYSHSNTSGSSYNGGIRYSTNLGVSFSDGILNSTYDYYYAKFIDSKLFYFYYSSSTGSVLRIINNYSGGGLPGGSTGFWNNLPPGYGINDIDLKRNLDYVYIALTMSGGLWRRPYSEMLPPIQPVLISPPNNALNNSLTPTLDWSNTGATFYKLQVSMNPAFSSFVINDSTLNTDQYVVPNGILIHNQIYYWRVTGRNNNGWGDTSSVSNFFTVLQPVSISTPANGSTVQTLTPTVTWTASSGATAYHFAIWNTIIAPITVIYEDTVTTTLTTVPSGYLNHSSRYYIVVHPFNSNGRYGNNNATHLFYTYLAAPNLVFPANGATGITLTPNMDWDTVALASSYWIQLSTNSGFSSILFQDTVLHPTSNLNIPSGVLNYSTTYYWRVRAMNAGGTNLSEIRSFTTMNQQPPPMVRLIYPNNGATSVPTSFQFDWADTTYSTKYQIQVSNNSGFSSTVWDTTVTPSYAVIPTGKLAYSTQYYWRVRGINGTVNGTYSSIWNFTTGNTPPPATAPVLTSPANNSTNVALATAFAWGSVSGATGYRIKVASDVNFNNIKLDTLISGTSITMVIGRLYYYTQYYWRVYASNAGGLGPSSAVWNFSTLQPVAPTLISPPSGTNTSNQGITFRWGGIQYITGYKFQLATDNGFTNIVQSFNNLLTDSVNLQGLSYSQYFWRVCAKGNLGDGPWSTVWNINVSGIRQISEEIPTDFKLYNNYPNPFNPNTKIRFDIPTNSNVRIVIYDITGKEITTLANGKYNVGKYEADFYAVNLPSGVYICRLSAGEYVSTNRMLLIK